MKTVRTLLAICNKIYTCPTIFSVASKPSYVKLRHRFIFVKELRLNSTFHNCKDDY